MPIPARRTVAVLGIALLAAAMGCDEDPPSNALQGTAPGLERWVVVFEGQVDTSDYRAALAESPQKARKVAEAMRARAIADRAPLAEQLRSFGARIVDYWWLTNAVTVELPAGNADSLKLLPGVAEVRPDSLLSP